MNGVTFSAAPRGLMCSIRSRSYFFTVSSRNAIISRELPAGVDVQQREGHAAGVEGLARQMQQHGRILADRIEHHRTLEFGGDFAEDVDGFVFEGFQMRVERRLGCSADC